MQRSPRSHQDALVRISQLVPHVGTVRQETVIGLSAQQIAAILGFEPTVIPESRGCYDEFRWLFTVDDNIVCSVWSHKGSDRLAVWSAFGPKPILERVFGAEHVRE